MTQQDEPVIVPPWVMPAQAPIWVVSYPRSGNNWVRYLLAHVLSGGNSLTAKAINTYVPDVHRLTDIDAYLAGEPAPFIKSHFRVLPHYTKVIYLHRDGRDCLVSLWHYERWAHQSPLSFDDFFDKFVRGDLTFGSWKAHVDFWLDWHNPESILIGYEDLYASAAPVLGAMLDFAGVHASTALISQAISLSDYKLVKARSGAEGVHPSALGLSGKPGKWREVLSDSQAEIFWTWAGDSLTRLGYSRT